jgi:hypothetical protein
MAKEEKPAKVEPVEAPVERPVRLANPKNVAKHKAAGWTIAKSYLGKTHRERKNIASGDIVPMRAPK